MAAQSRLVREPSFRTARVAAREWLEDHGLWWAVSATAHALALSVLMLIAGLLSTSPRRVFHASRFESDPVDTSLPMEMIGLAQEESAATPNMELASVEAADYPLTAPSELAALEPQSQTPAGEVGRSADWTGLFPWALLGSKPSDGDGHLPHARGGAESVDVGKTPNPFAERGKLGQAFSDSGGTQITQQAVTAALGWFARHQNPDGSWDLASYRAKCRDTSCTGPGGIRSPAGATSLALLPFLAAGQTHLNRNPYQKQIKNGLYWLLRRQRDDGDLSAGADQPMYAHALATIVLCEAWGLSGDRECGAAAQAAVRFIERAQNVADGGWRYQPHDPGDTSVVGWQVMALKSAQMAGLSVNEATLSAADRWLQSVGDSEGAYCYRPGQPRTSAMSAVGLLCREYLGAPRTDPVLQRGVDKLLANQPILPRRDTYYWYYATQVLHNWSGPDWDRWNRGMRRLLVETQQTTGCAAGSWDPNAPQRDAWGAQGGRLMVTSLSCLTLEVYYRYLPLYKLKIEGQADN
jgi:hypothetical protein